MFFSFPSYEVLSSRLADSHPCFSGDTSGGELGRARLDQTSQVLVCHVTNVHLPHVHTGVLSSQRLRDPRLHPTYCAVLNLSPWPASSALPSLPLPRQLRGCLPPNTLATEAACTDAYSRLPVGAQPMWRWRKRDYIVRRSCLSARAERLPSSGEVFTCTARTR